MPALACNGLGAELQALAQARLIEGPAADVGAQALEARAFGQRGLDTFMLAPIALELVGDVHRHAQRRRHRCRRVDQLVEWSSGQRERDEIADTHQRGRSRLRPDAPGQQRRRGHAADGGEERRVI
jgi:hypothetical protein